MHRASAVSLNPWPDDYIHDVFVSYPRIPALTAWVHGLFVPHLWLELSTYRNSIARNKSRIFVDEEQLDTGTHFSTKLSECHRRSRCLVAIMLDSYVESNWCMAELNNMMNRADVIHHQTGQRVPLVFPVIYNHWFEEPERISELIQFDFCEYRTTIPETFIKSAEGRNFEKSMQLLAKTIHKGLDQIPPWNSGWGFEPPTGSPSSSPDVPQPKMKKKAAAVSH